MLTRGTDKLSRQQIADEMTRLQMTGGLLGFQTTRTHLPDVAEAPVRRAAQRSFPADGVRAAATGDRDRAVVAARQPGNAVARCLSAHFNTYPPGDPRYYLPLKQRIEAVGKTPLDAVRKYHADFYGTARGEISIVGDFDDKAIEALLKERFAGWASKAPYDRVDREFRDVKPARLVIDTPDKENAMFRARLAFPDARR